MIHKLEVYNKRCTKKEETYNGYAFINEHGDCMQITYGEGNRDTFIKFFNKGRGD